MAKGAIAKAEVVKTLASAFGSNYIGEFNSKYYVWANDGGEQVQIAIALTCPKVQVSAVSSTGVGGDYNFEDNAPSPVVAPSTFTPAEMTDEEQKNIDELMARLGLV